MVRPEFLKSIPLFYGFTNKECQRILRLAKERHLPKGKVIFEEGQRGNALYIIVSGSVMIEKQPLLKSTGALSTLHLKVGDFFGELAFFDTGPRTSSARTLEKTTVIVLMPDDFVGLLKKTSLASRFLKNCIHIIATRIRHVNQELMVFYELGRLLSQPHSADSLCQDVLNVFALSLDAQSGILLLRNDITQEFEEKSRYESKKEASLISEPIDWEVAGRVLQEGRPFQELGNRPLLWVPFGAKEAKKGLILLSAKEKKGKAKTGFSLNEINMVSSVARLFETALQNLDYQFEAQSRQRLERRYITY